MPKGLFCLSEGLALGPALLKGIFHISIQMKVPKTKRWNVMNLDENRLWLHEVSEVINRVLEGVSQVGISIDLPRAGEVYQKLHRPAGQS